MIKQYFGAALLFLVLFTGCAARVTKSTINPPPPPVDEALREQDRILIVQFNVFRTAEGKDSVILASANVVDGFLKAEITDSPSIPAGKIRCSFLDMNDAILKSTVVDHPLKLSLELPPISPEDETHTNANLNQEKGGFIVRTRYTRHIKYVVVEKSDENQNPEYRIKFDLPII